MTAVVQARPDIPPTMAAGETATVLSLIERLARDPTVDIDRVERMMAVHKDMRREQAMAAFNVAMAAVQSELPQVKRDALNDHTRSKYARLETISAAVDPIITRHGMSLSFGTDDSPLPGHYRVVCDVSLGAHTKRYHLDMPADAAGSQGKSNKTMVQAAGSTLSYARRYLKLMIFDIALTNEDNDGSPIREPEQRAPARRDYVTPSEPQPIDHNRPVITPEQAMDLRDLLTEVGASEREFLAWLKLKRLEDIPADILAECIQAAKGYKGGRNAR